MLRTGSPSPVHSCSPFSFAQLPDEPATRLRSALYGLGGGAGEGALVAEIVEQAADRRLEPFHVRGGHLRRPVPQSFGDWTPGFLGIEAGAGSLPALMEAEHRAVVGNAEEPAQALALLGGPGDQRFVAHLAVEPGPERHAILAGQT